MKTVEIPVEISRKDTEILLKLKFRRSSRRKTQPVPIPDEPIRDVVNSLIRDHLEEIRDIAISGKDYGIPYIAPDIEGRLKQYFEIKGFSQRRLRTTIAKDWREILGEPQTNLRESQQIRISHFLDGMLDKVTQELSGSSSPARN